MSQLPWPSKLEEGRAAPHVYERWLRYFDGLSFPPTLLGSHSRTLNEQDTTSNEVTRLLKHSTVALLRSSQAYHVLAMLRSLHNMDPLHEDRWYENMRTEV
ncbi:hypothetical protein MANI_001856 [Metarhizium anisopliae]|nr:hypothetical protein MANI_001856 [Metarhizium anisopliae]